MYGGGESIVLILESFTLNKLQNSLKVVDFLEKLPTPFVLKMCFSVSNQRFCFVFNGKKKTESLRITNPTFVDTAHYKYTFRWYSALQIHILLMLRITNQHFVDAAHYKSKFRWCSALQTNIYWYSASQIQILLIQRITNQTFVDAAHYKSELYWCNALQTKRFWCNYWILLLMRKLTKF